MGERSVCPMPPMELTASAQLAAASAEGRASASPAVRSMRDALLADNAPPSSPSAADRKWDDGFIAVPKLTIAITPRLLRCDSDPTFSVEASSTLVHVAPTTMSELHRAVLRAALSDVMRALAVAGARGHDALDAALNAQYEHGYTPLIAAAALPDDLASVAILKLLLEAGANVNLADNEGFSPLHWASACGGAARVEALLRAGADANAFSFDGETPLHRAARFGRDDAVKCLLEAGADDTAQNKSFFIPLDVAGHWGGAVNAEYRARAVAALASADAAMRTTVYYHDDCLGHIARDGHQVRCYSAVPTACGVRCCVPSLRARTPSPSSPRPLPPCRKRLNA
ncbi:hypothetical protein EON62_01240 [archaeon]|nr:MAG: hypothetical protein EON62_01240 [archaeon]